MDMEKIAKRLAQIDGIEDLDAMLDSRERMRRVYSFLGDAYMTTQNPVFLDYADLIKGAGLELNRDLTRWVEKIAAEKGSDRFKDVGKVPGESNDQ